MHIVVGTAGHIDHGKTALVKALTGVDADRLPAEKQRGITIDREKPLHSMFGEYVKKLKEDGHIQSEMTFRILKSSISTLDAFNDVRNNRSFAHDNQLLSYEESLLIFNNIAACVRFVRALEDKLRESSKPKPVSFDDLDEIPF